MLSSSTTAFRRTLAAIVGGCFLAATAPAVAIDYTWSSSSTGGLWSGTTNWTPNATVTGTTNTATLGNATADRTVTYDNSGSITNIGSIIFSQTSAFTNLLDVQKNLTVTNTITLAASNGGLTRLLVSPVSGTTTTTGTLTANVNVNAGGMLSLGAYNPSGTNTVGMGSLTGNVNVAGGSFVVENGTKLGTATAASNYLTGTLTMSSGSMTISNTNFSDRRLYTNGLNVTGGDVNINGALYIQSVGTHSFTPATFFTTGTYTLGLNAGGNQSITLNTGTFFPMVAARGTGVKTFTSTVSGTNIGRIDLNDQDNSTAGSRATFKLGSNLTLAAGAGLPTAANYGATVESGTRADVGIDADTFTLNLASNSAVFTPNTWSGAVTSTTVQYWFFTGTAGTIIANGFKFDSAGVATSVGPGLVLESRAGNNVANVLSLGSGTGAIDSTSVFRYAGTAAVGSPSTLASTRAIGDVEVTSGALKILSLSGMQALRVNGGTLDLASNSLVVTTLSGSTGGAITSGSSGALTLTASSALNSTFAGVIQNGSGTVALTKADVGMLTLSGTAANTFSGLATVNSGTLELNKTAGVNAVGGNVQVNAGATLRLAAANQIADTGTVTVNAGGTWNLNGQNETIANLTQTGVSGTAPALTLGSGTLSLNAVSSTGPAGSPSTTIGGPGTMRFVPSGSTQPAFTTNYNNNTDISSAVQIDAAGLTFNLGTWGTTVSGKISGTGSVIKSSQGGALTLSNGSNDYSGGTQWTGFGADWGQMSVSASGALGSGTVTLNGGGNTTNWTTGNSGNDPSVFVFTGTTTHANNFSLTANSPIAVSNPRGSGASTDTVLLTGSFALGSNTLFLRGRGTGTISGPISGSGGITKIDPLATWSLSGSNAFTGATTITAGILSITNTTALQGTSGVTIAGGAGLTYTGGTATFGKNITVTAGSGTGTIRNSGGGLLTLSGNLSKDNSVLRLTGGAFNVTGLITGTTAGTSDLVVDAASVTLSNTNTYDGPTFVYGSGTLTLGIDNAIPNTSRVELGNATTRGTLDTGTFSDVISRLVFSGSGGTLRLSGDKTASAQLATSGSLSLGSNANLVLTSPGTSAGLYRLISFTSSSGSFANPNVTGIPTNYSLLYSATSIDLQMKANQATTFTLTPVSSRVLVGGSTTLSGMLANSSPTGAASLTWSPSVTGSLTGISSSLGSSIAAGGASTITATFLAGNTATSQSWSLVNTDNSAITTTSTASGSISVVNQRTFSVSNSGTINLGNFLRTAAVTGSATVSSTGLNATTANASLGAFSGTNTNGFSLATLDSTAFNGGSLNQAALYTLSGSAAAAGAINGSFTSAVTAELGSISPVSVALDGTAYDPATASFGASTPTTSLLVNIGEFNQNSGDQTKGFSIFNLFSDPTYTADLTLVSITDLVTQSSSLSIDLTPGLFGTLQAGGTSNWLATLTSGSVGSFSNQYRLNFVSSKSGQSLGGPQSMTLTVTGVIVVPEPGAIALAGIGIGFAGWLARRRRI